MHPPCPQANKEKSHYHINWCRKKHLKRHFNTYSQFFLRTLRKIWIEVNFLIMIQNIYKEKNKNLQVDLKKKILQLTIVNDWIFPLEDQEQGKNVSSFSPKMILKTLTNEIRQEKERKYRSEGRNENVPICRWNGFPCRKSQGIHTHNIHTPRTNTWVQ